MIHSIHLINWKSHHNTELVFNRGVNALIGEMGSGKSSVLEALTFALFGTTPALQQRAVKLEQMVRRSPQPAQESSVSVTFSVDENTYTVTRKITSKGSEAEIRRNDQLLESPSATKVTELVEQILGLTFDTFARALYAEQNTLTYLLHLTPADRKRTIDQLLQLDVFETVRKHAVTLKNSIQKTQQDKEKELQQYNTSELEERKQQLENSISQITDTLHGKQEQLTQKRQEKQSVETRFQHLVKQKQQYEQLTEQKHTLEGRIESLQSIVAEEDTGEDAETIQQRKTDIATQIETTENQRERYQQLQAEVSQIQQQIEKEQKEVERLQKQVQEYKHYESIAAQLDEKEQEYDNASTAYAQLETKLQSLTEEKTTLSEAAGTCPICRSPLTEEQRNILLDEKSTAIHECKQKKQEYSETLFSLQNKIAELKSRRNQLLQYAQSADDLKKKQKILDQQQETLEDKWRQLNHLQEQIDANQLDKLRKQYQQLERQERILTWKQEIYQLREQLQSAIDKIQNMDFSYEKYEQQSESLQSVQHALQLLLEQISHQQQLLEEKQQHKQRIEQELDTIHALEQEVMQFTQKVQFMQTFCKQLEQVQYRLRNDFLTSLNTLMETLWQDLYPYTDYTSVRIRGEDDYIIEVKNTEGRWVSVAAQTSGGEQQSAALVFRIALAVLLSPSLHMFILDEPTHNLDADAIGHLNNHLRDTVDIYVDQLFVITHEPKLESCVTGSLYRLHKKQTQHGLTEVEPVPLTDM